MKDFCIYCRSAIEHDADAAFVHCPSCGRSFRASLFGAEGKQLREKQEEVEHGKKQISELNQQKQALTRDKQAAEQRLNDTLCSLSAIHADLEAKAQDDAARGEALRKLTELTRETEKVTGEGFAAIGGLIGCLAEAEKNHDRRMSDVLQGIMLTQQHSSGKLDALMEFAQKLSSAQDDAAARFAIMMEYMPKIATIAQDNSQLMQNLVALTQTLTAEEAEALGGIAASVEELRKAQNEADSKLTAIDGELARVSASVNAMQSELGSFHSEYTEDKKQKLEAMYAAANHLFTDREYEKAEEKYAELIEAGAGNVAEVYWRKIMCRYGVEYVKSEYLNRYVPTLYNLDMTRPEELSDAKELMHVCAGTEDEEYYRENLKFINNIIARYEQVKLDNAYDVFISVKQQDGGAATEDSERAGQLYVKLQGYGLRVFNSRYTHIPAGEEYEPYILAALRSAKMLIIVSGRDGYIRAPWVENEWKRYLWLMRSEKLKYGKTERKLVAYLFGGMKAGDLPRGLQGLQAITEDPDSASKLNDALRSTFPNKFNTPAAKKDDSAAIEKRVNHAFIQLSHGDFAGAEKNLNGIMADDAENARVYLGLLLTELKLKTPDELANTDGSFKDKYNFIYALDYADESMKQQLNGYLIAIETRKKEAEEAKLAKKKQRKKNELTHEKWGRRIYTVLFLLFVSAALRITLLAYNQGTVFYYTNGVWHHVYDGVFNSASDNQTLFVFEIAMVVLLILTYLFLWKKKKGWAETSSVLNIVAASITLLLATGLHDGPRIYAGWILTYGIVMTVFACMMLIYVNTQKRHALFSLIWFIMAIGWVWPPFIDGGENGLGCLFLLCGFWIMTAAGFGSLALASRQKNSTQA